MNESLTARLAAGAYDSLGPFYDRFTAHHDYELWMDAVLRLARRHGLTGRRALDAGCGTGKSFLPLVERGFEVTGCDASRSMLAVAASKAPAGVELHCEDLRGLGVLGEFDLITCLDDVANYLASAADLTSALAALGGNLRPGGILVFDANTVATYRGFFGGCSVVEEPGLLMVWRGRVPGRFAPAELAEATLDAFSERDGCWVRVRSEHRQRHHPEATVRRCIARAGLQCLAVYGQDEAVRIEAAVDELRHTKAIYLATRSMADERR